MFHYVPLCLYNRRKEDNERAERENNNQDKNKN